MLPVPAKDLGKEVELARGHKEVADFGELGELLGYGIDLPCLDGDPNHPCRTPPQELRLYDGNDLEQPAIRQSFDTATYRSFRDPQFGGDPGER